MGYYFNNRSPSVNINTQRAHHTAVCFRRFKISICTSRYSERLLVVICCLSSPAAAVQYASSMLLTMTCAMTAKASAPERAPQHHISIFACLSLIKYMLKSRHRIECGVVGCAGCVAAAAARVVVIYVLGNIVCSCWLSCDAKVERNQRAHNERNIHVYGICSGSRISRIDDLCVRLRLAPVLVASWSLYLGRILDFAYLSFRFGARARQA